MKINEKSLSAYACYRDGVDKEGFLDKKGEVNHGYKRRWFTLKGNLLFYFEKPGDKQSLGVIILENCCIEICDSERHSFCIRYQGSCGTRTYVLCADNEKDMEKWMKALTSASYSYTEMLLKEFEKTVACLNSSKAFPADHDHLSSNSELFEETGIRSAPQKSKSKSMKMLARKFNSDNSDKSVGSSKKKLSENNTSNGKDSKSLDIPGRSRSSENLHKIHLQRSPKMLRKKMPKSPALRQKNVDYKQDETRDEIVQQGDFESDSDSSFFEYLHSKYGASIWTKIEIESTC